jgi:hypothetical protein
LTTRALAYVDSKVTRTMPRGVAVADFDRDGRVDLFVANAPAPGALYRNRGGGTFQVVRPKRAAVVNGSPSSGGGIFWCSGTRLNLLSGSGGTTENFVRIGHSLLALALAYVGGRLSRRLCEEGRRRDGGLAGAAAGPTVGGPAGRQGD